MRSIFLSTFILVVVCGILFAGGAPAYADSPTPPPAAPCPTAIPNSIPNPLNACTFEQLLNNILNFLVLLGGVIVVTLIAIAGLRFVISAGRPEEVKGSWDMVRWALIGYAILLLSKVIVAFLQGVLI